MKNVYIEIYYYDRTLQFYFNKQIKRFCSIKEAMNYMDKEFPIGQNVYSLDYLGETRCRKISHKYVVYAELSLY